MATRKKPVSEELASLADRQQFIRLPRRIGDAVNDLMTLRGYAQCDTASERRVAWDAIAGPTLASYSMVGDVRRGVLHVIVANSTVLQEITLRKNQILSDLNQRLPRENIRDLRLRVGQIQTDGKR